MKHGMDISDSTQAGSSTQTGTTNTSDSSLIGPSQLPKKIGSKTAFTGSTQEMSSDGCKPKVFSVAVDMAFQGHSSRQGYQFEPTYRPGEPRRKRRMSSSNDGEEPTVQPEGYSLVDMQWCLCGHCTIMTTERECHCCASSPRAIEKWRQLNSGSESNTCITFHPQFETACLLPHVLELLYRYHCMLRGRYRHAQWTNRLYRLFAYRAYVLWVHNNRKLGFGNRMILPACVVARIRAEFPAEEDDCYTGFQPFEGLWIFSEH